MEEAHVTTPPPPPPYYGPPAGDPNYPPPPAQNNTLGLIGMILGIISIPLACCAYLGIPVGIAGGVLGFLGLRKANEGQASNRSQAMTGLICGAVGVVLGIVILILSFSLSSFDFQHYIDTHSN
jgi:hypothetical protein